MSPFCRESSTPVFTSLPALPFVTPPQALVPSRARGNVANMKSHVKSSAFAQTEARCLLLTRGAFLKLGISLQYGPATQLDSSTTASPRSVNFWEQVEELSAFPGRHRRCLQTQLSGSHTYKNVNLCEKM